ncbi:hypothetical protein LZC95_49075 [Pendulispora brunnea]|uniref:SLC26A/SulP transporter domain-containing protein n=1 Tax=Pendulispora brunnea TaxID=2905690 RepID=A0ABZ2KAJ1_9BACT
MRSAKSGYGGSDHGHHAMARETKKMFSDWASTWKDVLRGKSLGTDLLSGITVAAVALPLNLALAVVSGLPPIAGLIAGSLGGLIAGALGGATLQVTGPAAALSMMVLGLATEFGPAGVAMATVFTGIVLLSLSALRAGKLAGFVPEAVLAGFTTGVGIKLLDAQLPELLGFNYKVVEIAQMMHRPEWLHDVSWMAAVSGLFVAFLVTTSARFKRFPAALVGIAVVTFVSVYDNWDIERVGTIPSVFPKPSFPALEEDRWLDLLLKATPLALLAGVESLLSARAVDRMAQAKTPHNPNLELFGQGVANLTVGMMSGMPVTGVIVRSGVNVQSGARTRLSSMVHALVLAACVLYLSPHIARIPLAALAGLLCVVGVRLIEVGTFIHLARAKRMQVVAFGLTAAGTVSGHLMMGLVAGLLVAWLDHYLRRDERIESGKIAARHDPNLRAVVGPPKPAFTYVHESERGPEFQKWLSNIRAQVRRAKSSYVHKQANVIGRIVMEEHVHVAAGSSVRADEGAPFFIGANTNIQDGVVIHALKDKFVRVKGDDWAVYVGKSVSIAHDALVHGPCFVGDHTFIGFKAVVHDSIIGPHCFIGIGAVVVGVELPEGRFVPHGTIVDNAEKAAALPPVSEAQHAFNEDVVEVNRGLAEAYVRQGGRSSAPATARRRLISHVRRLDDSAEAGWFPPARTKGRF